MIKIFKFRLVPNRKQKHALDRTLELCRHLYNCALERRGQRVGQFQQMRQLTEVRESFAEYQQVHVLQNAIKKLNRAFETFFRRLKNGEKPGFPRFKGKDRFDSFAFNNTGFSLEGKKLAISKIGNVRILLSRSLPAGSNINSLTMKRTCGS